MNEMVFFENMNNEKVFCNLSEPQPSKKKIVIMSHGFRGSSIGPARQFIDFQKILNNAGYSVLRFDQPHSGNSDGDYINSSFSQWVNTIVYFAKKYLSQGYKVALFGQSMGATASVIASNNPDIKGKIHCLLLWVPDAVTTTDANPDETYEEGGQKYMGRFWCEAKNSNFFQCLEEYEEGIHLVYGEIDRYVKRELIERTIQMVKAKKQPVMVLKGQDHSPWEYNLVQNVYREELSKLNKCMV